MATKKPLKAAKPAAKVSKSVKKPAPVKATSKAAKVAAPKSAVSKVTAKVTKAAKTVAGKISKAIVGKKVVAKASKPAAKAAVPKKQAAKPAAIKKIVPVKKASEKKETKATVPAKKATVVPEKKATKVVAPVAKKVEDKKAIKTTDVKASPVKPEPKEVKAVAPVKAAAPKAAPKKESKPVVIPKTSTDKKIEYEPDFMKSVLDAPAPTPQGPTMRYSDSELQEFRELINKKLDAAKKELAYLQGLITRRDEMGGDETDNRYMTMEDGGMSMEREQLSQMASRQITFIDHLEKAIMRIENKTYGICRVTGKLIDKARLRAVPHATLSMEAKLGIVK